MTNIPIVVADSIKLPSIHAVDDTIPDDVSDLFEVKKVDGFNHFNQPYLAWVQGEPKIIAADKNLKPIGADWQRMTHKWSSKDPLLKAVRKIKGPIFDLTAGLGSDAGLMATAGHKVILVERNPILASLLALSLFQIRLKQQEDISAWYSNLGPIYLADAMEFLDGDLSQEPAFYYDPMYASDSKKRLSRGSMQLIQDIAKADDDEAKIVCAKVLSLGLGRLIVKRSPKAKPLLENSTYAIEGKNVRLDVYVPTERI